MQGEMPRYIHNIQPCPIIAVTLDVPSPQYRSNNLFRSLTLVLALAVIEYFVTLIFIYDKGFIASSKHTAINVNIPILERFADGFYFSLDTLLDRG